MNKTFWTSPLSYIITWVALVVFIAIWNGFVHRIMSIDEFAAALYFSAMALGLHVGLKWAWEKFL